MHTNIGLKKAILKRMRYEHFLSVTIKILSTALCCPVLSHHFLWDHILFRHRFSVVRLFSIWLRYIYLEGTVLKIEVFKLLWHRDVTMQCLEIGLYRFRDWRLVCIVHRKRGVMPETRFHNFKFNKRKKSLFLCTNKFI